MKRPLTALAAILSFIVLPCVSPPAMAAEINVASWASNSVFQLTNVAVKVFSHNTQVRGREIVCHTNGIYFIEVNNRGVATNSYFVQPPTTIYTNVTYTATNLVEGLDTQIARIKTTGTHLSTNSLISPLQSYRWDSSYMFVGDVYAVSDLPDGTVAATIQVKEYSK